MRLNDDQLRDFYRRYAYLIQRRCQLLLGDTELAAEAYWLVWQRLYRRGYRFYDRGNRLRHIYNICDDACMPWLRRRGAKVNNNAFRNVLGDQPGMPLSYRQSVIEILGRLRRKARRIAVMGYIDGLSREHIARELGMRRSRVTRRMIRIRDRIDRSLA